jgi:hypothetical protein
MDPNACLERVEQAIRDRDFEEATLGLLDLAVWIDRGGFRPSNYLGRLNRLQTEAS